MARKIRITAKGLSEWRQKTWVIYASQFYNGDVLRLWTNQAGMFRVVYGKKTVYEGGQIDLAIGAWKSVS